MTKIAIVGKPNVGKSTIFNRLLKKNFAITSEIAGTTRDRVIQKALFEGYELTLMDTSGIQDEEIHELETDMKSQAEKAISEADIIMLVMDITKEPDLDDILVSKLIRNSKKPCLLIANKYDNPNLFQNTFLFYELGFGEPIPVSAIHKTGLENFNEILLKTLKKIKAKKAPKTTPKNTTKICILGKPNAGKSSLINALSKETRAIVSDIPGTTRDVLDIELKRDKEIFTLIDTAGVRKRGRIEKGIEKYSIMRAMEAIEKSDIVVLLIDGNAGISSQDQHIVEFVEKYKKGILIGVNKIDILDEEKKERILRLLRNKFTFLPWAPIIFISAKENINTEKVLEIASEIKKERNKRVSTSELNAFLRMITNKHLPASTKIQKPKFMYATQADINPPKFVLHFKYPKNLHFSYPRYLENAIRKEYGFNGTIIDMVFKGENAKTIRK